MLPESDDTLSVWETTSVVSGHVLLLGPGGSVVYAGRLDSDGVRNAAVGSYLSVVLHPDDGSRFRAFSAQCGKPVSTVQ